MFPRPAFVSGRMRPFPLHAAVLLFLSASLPRIGSAGVTLVENGRPRCVILAAAGESAAYAAKDLKYHLDRMAGCQVPLLNADQVSQAPEGAVKIILGDGPLA